MYCIKCGKEIPEGAKFCTNCGTSVDGIKTNIDNNVIEDEDLISSYVGNNYDIIKQKGFSFPALFTSLYLLYRKMYAYFFLYIVIASILVIFGPILYLAMIIMSGFFMNNIYMSFAKNRVYDIKRKNPNASREELKEICARKGGTSIVGPIIYIVIDIIIIFFIYLLIILLFTRITDNKDIFEYFKNIWGDYSEIENFDNNNYEEDNTHDEPVLENYTAEEGNEIVMQFTVLGDYKKEGENNRYSKKEGSISCVIDTYYKKTDESPDTYLNEFVTNDNKNNITNSGIQTNNYNNIEFKELTRKYGSETLTYYVTKKDNDLFTFIFIDSNKEKDCYKGHEIFKRSISYKQTIEEQNQSEHLKKISYSELENKMNNREDFILLISNLYCSHCNSFKPKFIEVLNNYNITAYEIDLSTLEPGDREKLDNKIDFNGTPTTIFIEKGVENDINKRIIGDTTREVIIEKLKNANYIIENNEKSSVA